MNPFLFALLVFLGYFLLACLVVGAFGFLYCVVDGHRERRRKQRRGGELPESVYRQVVNEAEAITRWAAR